MAEIIAQGTSWGELLAQQDQLDVLLREGEVGQLVLDGPFELPDFVLEAIYLTGQQLGVTWVEKPGKFGNRVFFTVRKQSFPIVAVISAIGTAAFALAGAFFLGVLAWTLLRVPAEESFALIRLVLIGSLVLGGLYIFQGFLGEAHR